VRYAIYFCPEPDAALARRAAQWLGRDAATAGEVAQVIPPGFEAEEFAELTADARRYGFHATIVAPFRLAGGVTQATLVQALDTFCAGRGTPVIEHLVHGRLGSFHALVARQPVAALNRLESDCLEAMQPFRAPLTASEINRRRPDALTPDQRVNLERWGYPYVREEFRFHMTLTNAVAPHRRQRVETAIHAHFAGLLGRPLAVGTLSIFVEPAAGAPFHRIHAAKLSPMLETRAI
jgi:putative phosphonate metabolism protein